MRQGDEREETRGSEEEERQSDWLIALLAAHAEAPPGRGVSLREVDRIARDIARERHREDAECACERAGVESTAFAADPLWSDEEIARLAAGVRHRVSATRKGLRLASGRPPEVVAGQDADSAPWFDEAIAAGVGRELWHQAAERQVAVPEGVPRGRYVALTIRGDSMTPLLHSGDVALVRLGSEVTAGAVIVAYRPDHGYVVKRVGRVARRSLELCSVNAEYERVVIPNDPRLLLGTVVLRWCAHGATQRGG